MLHIGIIREEKTPPDNRVPLSPEQCVEVQNKFPVKITVESSPGRCFPDEAYHDAGIRVSNDLSSCSILLGVKEVPPEKLMEGKTYLFFSHTRKKQAYNQGLMHTLIRKKIRMIDYECLTDDQGQRLLGFGFYAGITGAHHGLLIYGKKHKKYDLRPAHACIDYNDMVAQYRNVSLPPVKILLTGGGRVASGMLDIMQHFGISGVAPEEFRSTSFNRPVYTLLKGAQLYARKDSGSYTREDFHSNPEAYRCLFPDYSASTDILMNGIYWDQNIPRLFEKEAVQDADFRVSVIADITCDKDGSVPINIRSSSIADPVYGIDRTTMQEAPPYQSGKQYIDVLAVDNLPNELPKDASADFGKELIQKVFPDLLGNPGSEMIRRATICENGRLTNAFAYLSDYAYEVPAG